MNCIEDQSLCVGLKKEYQEKEVTNMPTYLSLINYTQQGAANIKAGPERLDMAREAARTLGAEIKEWYLTMGRYDAVAVIEAPNDEVVAYLLLAIGSAGNIQTETFRAFEEEAYRKLIANVP